MIYIVITFLLLVSVIVLYWYQRKSVFQPISYRNEDEISKLGELYSEFDLATVDGVGLEGAIYTPKDFKDTILYFGGRGQDSVGLMPKLVCAYAEYQIITINYREYGKSGGILTSKRIYDDALFVYDWVESYYGHSIVMGYSLGSSVAAYIASKKDVKLLYMVAPFDSLEKLIQRASKLPKKLIFFKFDNVEHIKKITSPVIIVSSLADKVTPPKYLEEIKKESKTLQQYKELLGYNHREVLFASETVNLLHDYLQNNSEKLFKRAKF
jgi:uncharacterized protein